MNKKITTKEIKKALEDLERIKKKLENYIEEDENEKIRREGREMWAEENGKALESLSCQKCDGVIVKSYATSMASQIKGKRCMCKVPKYSESMKKEMEGWGKNGE